MRILSVEVTAEEFEKLVALQRADVGLSHYTVERYLGLLLGMGQRVRGVSLEFGDVLGMVGNLSAAVPVPHRGRGRAGWRNGAA